MLWEVDGQSRIWLHWEGVTLVAGLRAEVGGGNRDCGQQETHYRQQQLTHHSQHETWSCLPHYLRGNRTKFKSVLCKEYRLDTVRTYRTLERLNLTKHPWPKGQTEPGQWNEAQNSSIFAWRMSLEAPHKHLGAPHIKTGSGKTQAYNVEWCCWWPHRDSGPHWKKKATNNDHSRRSTQYTKD